MPFLRSTTMAPSMSPLDSVRAFLQSIIGAPVFSRSSFTCVADTFAMVVLIITWTFQIVLIRCCSTQNDPRHMRAGRCAEICSRLLCFGGGLLFDLFHLCGYRHLANAVHHVFHIQVLGVRSSFARLAFASRHAGNFRHLVSRSSYAFHD